jgi:hypothetical protein
MVELELDQKIKTYHYRHREIPESFTGKIKWVDHPFAQIGFEVYLPLGRAMRMREVARVDKLMETLKPDPFAIRDKKLWRVQSKAPNLNRYFLQEVYPTRYKFAERAAGKFLPVTYVKQPQSNNRVTFVLNGRYDIDFRLPKKYSINKTPVIKELQDFFKYSCEGGINPISDLNSMFENPGDELLFLSRFSEFEKLPT